MMRNTGTQGRRSTKQRGATAAVLAIAASALTACGGGTSSSPTTTPRPQSPAGRVAFRRYLDPSETHGALFTSAVDGSGEKQITDPPPSAVDDFPDWSPDGTRLLFTRYAGTETDESHRLYTVSSDGGGLTPLSPDVAGHGDVVEGFDDNGVFSPDGAQIAFIYAHGHVAQGGSHGIPVGSDQLEFSSVVVMDVDGSNRNELTHDAAYSGDLGGVAWSPDGKQLVYSRWNSAAADPPNGRALFIIDVDGGDQRQLTPWETGASGAPDWSAATDRIVFRKVADEEAGVGNFFTIRPDGTSLTQITDFTDTVISHKVGFSSDGLWLVFAKTPPGGRNTVFVQNTEGSDLQPVTNGAQTDSSPDWSTSAEPSSASADGTSSSWPDSIVVIGHSGATGYNSDPAKPNLDAPENSWATGTNPAVNSVYLRVLTMNPAVAGHNFNLATDGATVDGLIGQARNAVALVPLPELILVQTIDHDVKCDGTDPQNYQRFGDILTQALGILAAGAPNAKVFVVTQPGTVASNADAAETNPSWVRNWQGDGPCDAFDPSGQRADDKIARLQDITDHYFVVQADSCAKFPNCSDDQGAWQRIMIDAADFTPDGNHPSIQGAAERAAVTWTALYG